MIQCGCGLCFTLKAGERLCVSGNLIGQELEGNETVKPRVFGLVDNTHTAAAQFLHNAVVRDGLTDHSWQILLG
jgi:hypothetical protein